MTTVVKTKNVTIKKVYTQKQFDNAIKKIDDKITEYRGRDKTSRVTIGSLRFLLCEKVKIINFQREWIACLENIVKALIFFSIISWAMFIAIGLWVITNV